MTQSTSADEPVKVVRLSINLNPETADTLKDLAARQGLTITEAVRRAISVYSYVIEAKANNEQVQLVGNGRVRELVFP